MALKNSRRQHGISTVEAALVLPVMLLVSFGLIEYANLLLRIQQIENVAREATRLSVLPDTTKAQVDTLVSSMMTSAGLQSSGYTATYSDPASYTTGQQVTVKIQLTYKNVAITNAQLNWLPVPATIGRTVVMAKEGP